MFQLVKNFIAGFTQNSDSSLLSSSVFRHETLVSTLCILPSSNTLILHQLLLRFFKFSYLFFHSELHPTTYATTTSPFRFFIQRQLSIDKLRYDAMEYGQCIKLIPDDIHMTLATQRHCFVARHRLWNRGFFLPKMSEAVVCERWVIHCLWSSFCEWRHQV